MIVPYQTNTVQNTDLPSIRNTANATADSFGGGQTENLGKIGRAASNLGETTLNIALTEQNKVNHDIARKSVNDARLEMSKIASAEYAKNGSDAFGATQRIQEQAAKIREKYSGSMETMAQQDIFGNVFDQYSAEHAERAMRHEEAQKEVFRNQTIDQENAIHADEITANMGDPKMVESRIFDISQNVRSVSKGRGDIEKRVEGVVRGVLMNAIAEKSLTDPRAALVFLEAHQDKLNPAQAMTMRDSLQKKDFEIRKAELTTKVVQETENEQAAIEAVMKTNQPDSEKQAIIKDIHSQYIIKNSAQEKAQRDYNEASWNKFYQKPDLVTIESMNVSPMEKQKMKDSLVKMTEVKTNAQYSEKLGEVQMLSNDEFLKKNLEEIKHDLSPADYVHLKKEQTSLRKELEKGQAEKNPNLRSAITDATTEAKEWSIFNAKEKDSDVVKNQKQALLNQYIGEYSQRLLAYPEEKRNDPAVREMVKKQLVKEKIDKGWIWDSPSGKYEYTPSNTPPTKEEIVQSKTLSDKDKAAQLIRTQYKDGKISKEEALQQLDSINK